MRVLEEDVVGTKEGELGEGLVEFALLLPITLEVYRVPIILQLGLDLQGIEDDLALVWPGFEAWGYGL